MLKKFAIIVIGVLFSVNAFACEVELGGQASDWTDKEKQAVADQVCDEGETPTYKYIPVPAPNPGIVDGIEGAPGVPGTESAPGTSGEKKPIRT